MAPTLAESKTNPHIHNFLLFSTPPSCSEHFFFRSKHECKGLTYLRANIVRRLLLNIILIHFKNNVYGRSCNLKAFFWKLIFTSSKIVTTQITMSTQPNLTSLKLDLHKNDFVPPPPTTSRTTSMTTSLSTSRTSSSVSWRIYTT